MVEHLFDRQMSQARSTVLCVNTQRPPVKDPPLALLLLALLALAAVAVAMFHPQLITYLLGGAS